MKISLVIIATMAGACLAAPQQRFVEDRRAPDLLDEGITTTTPHSPPIPILRESRKMDPETGAFIYDYVGADGSSKYEIRYPDGYVVGNFSFINAEGTRETRHYSAGVRGTEIAGDSVVSPAPPTLVDETTGENYVDLGNYELYKHLEEAYVHQAGASRPRAQQQPRQFAPIDQGDDTRFVAQAPQQPRRVAQAPQHQRAAPQPHRVAQAPQQQRAAPQPHRVRTDVQFDPSAIRQGSPNQVLDSLIGQFN